MRTLRSAAKYAQCDTRIANATLRKLRYFADQQQVLLVLVSGTACQSTNQTFPTSTSDQARLPAEFKHINKRRKRNQKGFPE